MKRCRCSFRIFSIGLFSFACIFCFAQTAVVKGKILDAKTGQPLSFANVFINQTTFCSSAALDGSFVLSNIPYGSYKLIVSYVGYRTHPSKLEVAPGKQIDLRVNLTATETQLTAVEVKTNPDKSWARSLQRFNAEFFGKSEFTKSCKILNPWVLDFKRTDEGILYFGCYHILDKTIYGLGFERGVIGPKEHSFWVSFKSWGVN